MATLGVYRVVDAATQLVGHLSMSDGSFVYDSSYLQAQTAGALSCSLPLYAESFSQDEARPYFEGLLPEGHARQAIAAALHVREENYLSLLAGYGFECIGDVIIASENEALTSLYEPIDVTNLANDLGENKAAEINAASRLSLAGTQNKVGLYHDPLSSCWETDWYRPLGGAPSTHILKTSPNRNVLYLEYLCTKASLSCGVPTANIRLLDLNGPVVCSERYDRSPASDSHNAHVLRRHQEDFTQALCILPGSKYAELEGGTARSIAAFIRRRFSKPIEGIESFARLTLFNYLIGNCDNHLKNMSILYSPNWREMGLAPAYDLICTTWFPNLSREMGMLLGGEGRIDRVEADHLSLFAKDIGLPTRRLRTMCSELADRIDPAIDDAAAKGPAVFDELEWKAADLHEDIAPRKEVLATIAGSD